MSIGGWLKRAVKFLAPIIGHRIEKRLGQEIEKRTGRKTQAQGR